MTQINKPDESKKLSPESKQLLDELGTITTKAADLVPRLYKSLENDGLGNSEIFAMIKEKIDISRARLYDLIPPEGKRPYKKVQKLDNSKVKEIALSKQSTIPPPLEIHKEAEIIPEEEPSKTITDKQILILDSRTCKGWPCEKYFTYKIEYRDGNAIRMYSI